MVVGEVIVYGGVGGFSIVVGDCFIDVFVFVLYLF